MAEQVLDVEHALGVDLLQLDQRAFAEAALERVAIDAESVLAHVDTSAGHPGAGPGTNVAEHDRPTGSHVLEGESLGVRAVHEAAARVVDVLGGLAAEHHVGAREADAEARVGRALHEEPAALGPVCERLPHGAVHPLALRALALEDRHRSAEHRLPDAVLRAAFDSDDDAVGVEGPEALARD